MVNNNNRYQQSKQSPLTLIHTQEHKQTMIYGLGNPGPGLGQVEFFLY